MQPRSSLAAGSTEPSTSIDPTRSKTSTVSATRDGNSSSSQWPTRISSGRPLFDRRVELNASARGTPTLAGAPNTRACDVPLASGTPRTDTRDTRTVPASHELALCVSLRMLLQVRHFRCRLREQYLSVRDRLPLRLIARVSLQSNPSPACLRIPSADRGSVRLRAPTASPVVRPG